MLCSFHLYILLTLWSVRFNELYRRFFFCVVKKKLIKMLSFFSPLYFACEAIVFYCGEQKRASNTRRGTNATVEHFHALTFSRYNFTSVDSTANLNIPQWLSGLLLLAETYSESCCQFSWRWGESFFGACLFYKSKSTTLCSGTWIPVSDMAVKNEASVWQTGSISTFSSEKTNVFFKLSKWSWLVCMWQ